MSANINLNLKDLPKKIVPFFKRFRRYLPMIVVMSFLLGYSFLALNIKSFNQMEPDQSAVLEKLSHTKRPRIDQTSIDKLKELEDHNVQVKALFKNARQNPFSE